MNANKTQMDTNNSLDWLTLLLDWSYGGIDFAIPGNGGVDCRDHIPVDRRIWETILGVATPSLLLLVTTKSQKKKQSPQEAGDSCPSSTASNNNNPKHHSNYGSHNYSLLRLFLLVSLSFTFGMEVGYKFATKQLIFLMNPCHVTSLVQVYLLAMPSDYFGWHNGLYKTMLHYLHGPTAAMLFPVTEPLQLPFEKEIYWIQHVLILLVPAYFMLWDDGHGYRAHR